MNDVISSGTGTTLQEFQLSSQSIQSKSSKEWGLAISKYIDTTIQSGYGGYYFNRNARFRANRNAANGKVNMQRFQDLLEFNGKTNYANINWQSIKIINRIISGLVGRWMNKLERINVTATDPLSIKDKKEQYDNIEFLMENRKQLEELEAQSGEQMIPKDIEIPADKEELNLWVTQFQRLPEEILYESGINDILAANGWFDTNKELALHDSAQVGFVGTYTWMDEEGVIHVDRVYPENAIYSWSQRNDFGDTTWRGRIVSIKISELRRRYGKQFNPDNPLALTEEQLFQIAGTSKEYQYSDKVTWNIAYNNMYLRPYDEYNVDAIEFEIKTVDGEAYTKVVTKKNKSTLLKKGLPAKPTDNEVAVHDTNINIYRGVYLRSTQTLLEWGLKKNMIRPQDPKEIGNAEFSYSFYMYQNYEMRNVAVPEKIEEPADQMILARLKMQQLVAKMRPTGAAYNIDALQEIDLGLASGVSSPSDIQKIYDQTGNLYYRGRDAEGNPIPVPVQELANSGFLNQMKGLIDLYQYHYQVLKDELGEDPALMAQAVTPRVTQGNVNTAQEIAENNTDYMYNAYSYVMADTAKKIACLLKDSVEYGANVYRAIIQKDDVSGRIFGTRIELLPTAQDLLRFEANVNQYIAAQPDLILFVDPMQLMRVAKENLRMGEVLFRRAQKKMLLWQQETAQQNQQATIQGQIQSAQAAEQAKQQTESMKGDIDIQKVKVQEESAIKVSLATMFTSLLKDGGTVPSNMQPLLNAYIENIMVPLTVQNEEQKQAIIQQMRQAQAEASETPQQQQMEQQQGAEMPTEEQEPQIQSQQPIAA